MLRLKTTIISIFIFLILLPSSTFAAIDAVGLDKLLNPFGGPSIWGAAEEFCEKRSGELMNLETWFSGKCGETVKSSIQGDGVGFVDIVVLQGLESLFALIKPPHIKFTDYIIKTIEWMLTQSETAAAGNLQITPNPMASGTIFGGLTSGLSFLMTTKPASSKSYIDYVASNLKKNHIVSDTYAAGPGYGFNALSPLLPIWKAFRNISYMLFALAFVLYGLMIMFRIRIDSKTAASITLAIPKLVSTLLLITFSYAIVGFMIDLSTVLMALAVDVLRMGGIITGYQNWFIKAASGQSILGLIGSMLLNGIVGFLATPVVILNLILGGLLGTIGGIAALAVGAFIPGVPQGIMGIMIVVFFIAILVSYGKIFLSVLKSYIAVVIHLIFAPIMILPNIFPGSSAFSNWLKNIVANLAVFPVVTFFLVLSYALMMQPLASIFSITNGVGFLGVRDLTQDSKGFWTPPMTSVTGTITENMKFLFNFDGNWNSGSAMLALVGLMFLFMSSKYADMVLEALKVPPFKYGSAIGEALKMGMKGNNWEAKQGYKHLPLPQDNIDSTRDLYKPTRRGKDPTIHLRNNDTGVKIQ